MEEQARTQQAAACERVPWSLAVRGCIVASKTHQDTATCF
jgi:hypothetical protein